CPHPVGQRPQPVCRRRTRLQRRITEGAFAGSCGLLLRFPKHCSEDFFRLLRYSFIFEAVIDPALRFSNNPDGVVSAVSRTPRVRSSKSRRREWDRRETRAPFQLKKGSPKEC